MYIGDLPGYYFDQDKQKYFRVQPGHKLPSQARYSSANVRREDRARKRLKTAERDEKRKCTRVASVLQGHHGSSALLMRETGMCTTVQARDDTEHAIVSNLVFSRGRLTDSRVTEDAPLSIFNMRRALNVPQLNSTLVQYEATVELIPYDRCKRQHDLELSQSNNRWPVNHRSIVGWARDSLTCVCNLEFESNGTLFFNVIALDDQITQPCWFHRRQPLQAIELPVYPYSIAVSWKGGIALASTNAIICTDLHSYRRYDVLPLKRESKFVDWLTPDTIAFGQEKSVRLWDVRTKDSSTRIHHRKRVTGLKVLNNSSDSQLLVSDNHSLKLYDLRMTSKNRDRYPVAFTGVHGGPNLLFDANKQGLVAAHMDEQLKIFSLNSGKKLRTFELPTTYARPGLNVKPGDMSQLLWQEDGCGSPFIQICTPKELWRWALRDHNDD